MERTDIVDHADGFFFLTDDHLDDQLRTISQKTGPRFRPGEGALQIHVAGDGMARVTVDVSDTGFPAIPVGRELIDECIYTTALGAQRVRHSWLEEAQGQLDDPVTPSGPARVHVRMYKIPGPHEPVTSGIEVTEHVLLHIWNEAL
ncbi:hypothetical protein [Nocardia sp. CS682]|uniref:hypothetical protein n=1 Tax=Nocardia sp. CS682 TaxID=1047172 RepID=UPI001074B8A6|nr:hypothetical protein [Nocardia sp. CS682]QBS39554.1 hypothetical protein DMB37_04820 [Nocardia sp. CS682]